MKRRLTRRRFLAQAGVAAAGTILPASPLIPTALGDLTTPSRGKARHRRKKVIVLGIDGMDPRLCRRLMDAGELPALAKMRALGGHRSLGTSIPPQSPVAWANFITGADPGVHGIFDFLQRHPEQQYHPFYAAAETVISNEGWEVGDHRIPLSFWPFNHNPTQTLLRREGTPFWDYLDRVGVPSWIYDIPSNYPPSPSQHGNVHCLSGMGVPDLLGTYGTYQLFSDSIHADINEGGGMRRPLIFKDHTAVARLVGPQNVYLKKPKDTNVELRVYRHPTRPVARIELQGQTVVLNEGEWSRWCKVDYRMEMPSFLPDARAKGVCRFYLQEVRPNFRLYVSPCNIDPSDPCGQRISEPGGFVTEISNELGLFYTTGFQEDHKALANGVFSDEEYRRQADYVLEERMNLLRYAIDHYDDGLLFFYFSSTDLQSHMFWWDSDDPHPVRSPEEARGAHRVIAGLYRKLDRVVADIVNRYGDEATVLVMSDHGFCNFGQQFGLNRWLGDQGYIRPGGCRSLLDPREVDWRGTQAYGLGLNGLYLNLQGRERDGVVRPAERDRLLEEIRAKLLAVRDPYDGQPVIANVYRSDEVYHGACAPKAPDLIIGYHRGFRTSWATALGGMDEDVVAPNDSAWSADHCMDAGEIPGVVFCNKPILHGRPSLVDLAPTILREFEVEPPENMTGKNLFKPEAGA